MTEKLLEDYDDVFADIVNVLLFDGKRIVKEEELERAQEISVYKAETGLHQQERDVSKYWRRSNVRIAIFGAENQTEIDRSMPIRVIGYDGAAYRSQLLDGERPYCPVVTLVLYFGNTPWVRPTRLSECIDIPEELGPFVNDYRINVFDIPRLSEETVEKFQSDFRIVADYFVQLNRSPNYEPSKAVIQHVHEVLQLMSVLTGEQWAPKGTMPAEKGENVSMYQFLNDYLKKGTEKGREEGAIALMTSLVRDGILTLAEAARRLGITEAQLRSAMEAAR